MEKVKKYIIPTLAVLLVLALITAGVFGFMWGRSSADNQLLRNEKKAYLQIKHDQDSVITAAQGHIVVLTDSINDLVKDAVAVNDGTNRVKVVIKEDKQKMNEKISTVPTLSVGDQLKLFAKQSEAYQPPRP